MESDKEKRREEEYMKSETKEINEEIQYQNLLYDQRKKERQSKKKEGITQGGDEGKIEP